MLDRQQLDYYEGLIEAGQMDHDKVADLFMSTDVGASTGIDRATLLAKLHASFPDAAYLNTYLHNHLAMFRTIFLQARRH